MCVCACVWCSCTMCTVRVYKCVCVCLMCVLLPVTASASVCSPLSLAIRVLCLEEVCQSVGCLVFLCLCVWLLGLLLVNSVPAWI